MLILLLLILTFFACQFNKEIRLNSIVLYVLAVILSALTLLFPEQAFFSSIANGEVGLAFLITIMLTGSMPKGSFLKTQLRNIRKEYALLAFIFITPHALLNIYNLFLGFGYLEVFGLLSFVFMIPLIVSSFQSIKRNIKTSTWIRIHRLAYLIFLLLFIHLISVSNMFNAITYSIIFAVYLFLKLNNYYFKKHKIIYSTMSTFIIIASIVFLNFNTFEYNYDYINYLENVDFEDGIYYGSSDGYRNYNTSLYVSIIDNKIVNITLIECGCTPYAENGFYLDSAYVISNSIVNLNRTDVDAISGATSTSISINEAVIDALSKAKK